MLTTLKQCTLTALAPLALLFAPGDAGAQIKVIPADPPRWIIDSMVDLARGDRMVVAALAGAPVHTRLWGEMTPTLLLACHTPSAAFAVRVIGGAPALYGGRAPIELRFDSLPAQKLDAAGVAIGQHPGTLPYGDPSSSGSTSYYIMEIALLVPGGVATPQGRGAARMLESLLRARRVQVRYELLTGESVTLGFQPGVETGPAVIQVLRACQMELEAAR